MKTQRKTRLAVLALAAALVGSLLLSSCGQQETQTGDQTQTQSGQAVNVNYGISNPWDSLMPYYSVSGSNYARMIYDKLYDRLAYVHADGTLSPRAAKSWEGSEDGYTALFHLDRTAVSHDLANAL